MIIGDLLAFDLRPQLIRREDYVVLEVTGPDDKLAACKWHLSAGRREVAESLRRLADRLEGKL